MDKEGQSVGTGGASADPASGGVATPRAGGLSGSAPGAGGADSSVANATGAGSSALSATGADSSAAGATNSATGRVPNKVKSATGSVSSVANSVVGPNQAPAVATPAPATPAGTGTAASAAPAGTVSPSATPSGTPSVSGAASVGVTVSTAIPTATSNPTPGAAISTITSTTNSASATAPAVTATPTATTPTATSPFAGTTTPTAPATPMLFASSHSPRTGGGDIVLSPEPEPSRFKFKFKPWMAIAGGVIAVLLVVVIVLAVVNGSEKDSAVLVAEATADAEEKFYAYANYLVSGEEETSADLYTDLENPEDSQLAAVLAGGDEAELTAFLDRAQVLLDDFEQSAQEREAAKEYDDEIWLDAYARNTQEYMAAFRAYYTSLDRPDLEAMMTLYFQSGAKVMTKTVSNAYADLAEDTELGLAGIAENRIQVAADLVVVLDFYDEQGCLVAGATSLAGSCSKQLALSEEVSVARAELIELEETAADAVGDLLENVFMYCRAVYRLFDHLAEEEE